MSNLLYLDHTLSTSVLNPRCQWPPTLQINPLRKPINRGNRNNRIDIDADMITIDVTDIRVKHRVELHSHVRKILPIGDAHWTIRKRICFRGDQERKSLPERAERGIGVGDGERELGGERGCFVGLGIKKPDRGEKESSPVPEGLGRGGGRRAAVELWGEGDGGVYEVGIAEEGYVG